MNHRQIFWRTVFTLLLSHAGIALSQELPADSLLMRLYEQAAARMSEGEYDSAQACFDRAFAVKEADRSPVYPILLNEQATLYFYVGELEKAFELKKSVLPYLPQVEDLEKHVSVYNDLGVLYHRFNRQDSSLYFYNKALDAAIEYGDDSWIANLSLNLGVFYSNHRQYEEAERCIDNALKHVVRTDDISTTFYIWQVRSAIKVQAGKPEESGESVKQAWRIACSKQGSTEWKVRCIPSFYRYFKQLGENDSIRHYIRLGNTLLGELPPNSISAIGFIQTRAQANYEQKRYAEALKDFEYLYSHPTGTEKKALFEQMAVCYHHMGKDKLAFAYMDSARILTDSLARKEVTSQMAELSVKYQTKEKELEVARLQQQMLKSESNHLKTAMALLVGLAILLIALLRLRLKHQLNRKELERVRQERELESAQSYIEGLEEECKYFAKELHDGIANDLLSLEMKAQLNNDADMKAGISTLRKTVRAISHELMPPEFELLSLKEILAHYAASLTENTGIAVSYRSEPKPEGASAPIPQRTARELYRIVQEVTMNMVKYAQATRIGITFGPDLQGRYRLQIVNDGKPMAETPLSSAAPGIGLRTINDRAKALQATYALHSDENGNCFTLTFNAPSQDE